MPSVPELCLATKRQGRPLVSSTQPPARPTTQPRANPNPAMEISNSDTYICSAPPPSFLFFFFFSCAGRPLKLQLSLRRQSRAISIPTKHHLRHGRFRLLFASRSPIHPPHASPSLPASCLCLSCCAKRAFRLRGDADPRSGKEGPRRHRHPRCPREARGIPKRRCGPLNYNSKNST
jgi:hypothetical protein